MQTTLSHHTIIGMGTDLLDVRRFERVLQRHPQRALTRLFSPHEQAYAMRQSRPVMALGKRFAAKEACVKALGWGIGRVGWRDMEVWNDALGKPYMRLSQALQSYFDPLEKIDIFLSLTDEYPYVQATALIARVHSVCMQPSSTPIISQDRSGHDPCPSKAR